MNRIPGQFPQLEKAQPIALKNILLSKTMLGIVITLVSKALGIESGVIQSPVDQIASSWPILVGLAADLAAFVARLKTTKWSKPKGAEWLGVLSGICTILGAFGADASTLQGTIDHGVTAWPNIAAILGAVITAYGQIKAKKALSIKPMPGQLLAAAAMLTLLPSCASQPGTDATDACPLANRTVRKSSCVAIRSKPSAFGALFAWADGSKLWRADDDGIAHVTVGFIDGTKKQQALLWQRFQVIDELAPGLTFTKVAVPQDADIRASFGCEGHWSYFGRDARSKPKNEATLNVELSAAEFRDEWDRVGLHEVLHAIGLDHEHQHPQANIPWNRERVYDFYERTQGWSREDVDFQVLNRRPVKDLRATTYDADSIMEYPIPAELTDGKLVVGWNRRLTDRDRQLIAALYPTPAP